MADKAPPYKFTTNVPVQCDIRFVDIRPGKPWTDPKTGKVKALPSQVSIKGTFDGTDTICYLPGPAWKNVKALTEGGVIAGQAAEEALRAANDENLAAPHSVSISASKVTLTLAKPAGERYESLVVDTGVVRQPAVTGAGRIQSPYIPGIDGPEEPQWGGGADIESDPPYPLNAAAMAQEDAHYAVAPQDHLPPRQSGMAKMPSTEALRTAPNAAIRARITDDYLALLTLVRKALPDMSDDATQAAAATIFIAWDKAGVR